MSVIPKNYKLKVESEIFQAYPDYVAFVVYAQNIINSPSDEYSINLLREAEQTARKAFSGRELGSDSHISAWRDAFRNFGAKPKKYFCGAEALLRRILLGENIPAINQVVDIYNAISIKYAIPIGGEDWTKITSDLNLTLAKGAEPFATLTSEGERIDFPAQGEIIWTDSTGVTVRRWNWRQCFRTRITAETTDAYFVLDRLSPLETETVMQACNELIAHLKCLSSESVISTEVLKTES